MFEKIVLLIASYLAGSIPSGLIFSKIFVNIDIRNLGSGNIGTANVIRNAGLSIGVLTFVFDVLKGAIPTFLALRYFQLDYGVIAGLLSFLGHICSIFLKFKGGKGVATAFGVMLTLNYISALIAFGIFLVTMVMFRISSLSSLLAAIGILIVNFIMQIDSRIIALNLLLTTIIFIVHRANIYRLINKTEPKMWGKK